MTKIWTLPYPTLLVLVALSLKFQSINASCCGEGSLFQQLRSGIERWKLDGEKIVSDLGSLDSQLQQMQQLQWKQWQAYNDFQSSLDQEQGDPGESGATGPDGDPGEDGGEGDPGMDGPAGPTGPQGPPGIKGPMGEDGPDGEKGWRGKKGWKGDRDGPPGTEPGPKGTPGDPGETVPGAPGPKGPSVEVLGPDGCPGDPSDCCEQTCDKYEVAGGDVEFSSEENKQPTGAIGILECDPGKLPDEWASVIRLCKGGNQWQPCEEPKCVQAICQLGNTGLSPHQQGYTIAAFYPCQGFWTLPNREISQNDCYEDCLRNPDCISALWSGVYWTCQYWLHSLGCECSGNSNHRIPLLNMCSEEHPCAPLYKRCVCGNGYHFDPHAGGVHAYSCFFGLPVNFWLNYEDTCLPFDESQLPEDED